MSKRNRDFNTSEEVFEEKTYTTEELKALETEPKIEDVVEESTTVDEVIKAVVKNEPVPEIKEEVVVPLLNAAVPKTIISEPVESTASISLEEYPNAMYKFSVYGNNGMLITPNKDDVSPCDRCALSLLEARDAISRGFILRWRHPSYLDSEWYDCILNRYNMDSFAAFIKEEIATRRLPYIYLG